MLYNTWLILPVPVFFSLNWLRLSWLLISDCVVSLHSSIIQLSPQHLCIFPSPSLPVSVVCAFAFTFFSTLSLTFIYEQLYCFNKGWAIDQPNLRSILLLIDQPILYYSYSNCDRPTDPFCDWPTILSVIDQLILPAIDHPSCHPTILPLINPLFLSIDQCFLQLIDWSRFCHSCNPSCFDPSCDWPNDPSYDWSTEGPRLNFLVLLTKKLESNLKCNY